MNHSKLISNLILKTVKIQSGPAAVALQELSGVLVTLTALLEEGGALQQAPVGVKEMANICIESCKNLADSLATSIGTGFGPPKEEVAPEEIIKKEVPKKVIKKKVIKKTTEEPELEESLETPKKVIKKKVVKKIQPEEVAE